MNDLILRNLFTGDVNIGTTLAALRDVTANMTTTTVPNISTNFTGIVYLGGTLNLRTVIEENVTDINNLQQDLTDANTTITDLEDLVDEQITRINQQAEYIESLQTQIEVLNLQYETFNISNGFLDQISNNPFDNPFGDLLEDLPDP